MPMQHTPNFVKWQNLLQVCRPSNTLLETHFLILSQNYAIHMFCFKNIAYLQLFGLPKFTSLGNRLGLDSDQMT